MSLAELLTAVALVGLVLSGMLGALQQGQQAYAIGAARVEAQQNGRIALERLTREIRAAGAGGGALRAAPPPRSPSPSGNASRSSSTSTATGRSPSAAKPSPGTSRRRCSAATPAAGP